MSKFFLNRATHSVVGLSCFFLFSALISQAAAAQLNIDVKVGFSGQFMSDRYTPIEVLLSYQGPPISGELLLVQESQHPLEKAKRFSETRILRLGASASQRIMFYFPLSHYPWPETEEAALLVKLSSGGDELYSKKLAIPGDIESEPLVLGVSETGFLRSLPTGERLQLLNPDDLPEDWRGYHGVRRLYLGRLRTDQLSQRQQAAIEQWLISGGELVVLAGENFYLQDSGWLRELVPFVISSIRADEGTGLPTIVIGSPTGEVLAQIDQTPLLVKKSVGRGAVYFSTAALNADTGIERPVWDSLLPFRSRREDRPDLGAKLLAGLELPYPSKPLIGGILALYLIGFAYFSLWVLRQPLATLLSSPEGGAMRRKRQGWKVVGFAAGWVILFSAPSTGYLTQPLYNSYFHSIEVGITTGEEGLPWGWTQTWYSVVSKKEQNLALAVSDESLVIPLAETQVSLTQSGASLWDADFLPSPMKSWSTRHVYSEQMMRVPIEIVVSYDDSSVRGSHFQVYNGSGWDLRDTTLFRNGAYFPLGDLPSGKTREVQLDGLGESVWPELGRLSGRWTPEERIQNAVMSDLRIADELQLSDRAWVLLAWVQMNQFSSDPREIRHGLELIMIRSKERR